MSTASSPLLFWALAGQLMLLIGAAWLLARRAWRVLRLPCGLLAAVNLLLGLAALGYAAPADWPHAVSLGLPLLLLVVSGPVLWMLALALFGQPVPRLEPLVTAAVLGLPLLWLGLVPAHAALALGWACLAGAWVLLRGGGHIAWRLRIGIARRLWRPLFGLALAGAIALVGQAVAAWRGTDLVFPPRDAAWPALSLLALAVVLNLAVLGRALGGVQRQLQQLSLDTAGKARPDPQQLPRALEFEWHRWQNHGERPALLALHLVPAHIPARGTGGAAGAAATSRLLRLLHQELPLASVVEPLADGRLLVLLPNTTLRQGCRVSQALVALVGRSPALRRGGFTWQLQSEVVVPDDHDDDTPRRLRARALGLAVPVDGLAAA